MAEIVITAAVTVLFEKLASADFMNLVRSEGLTNQLNKWKKHLTLIQAVLDDAAQQKITKKPVELWLHQLHDLAYDIEDVLDDMATEVIRRKFNQEYHVSSSTSQVLKIIPTCCTNFTPRKIKYGRKISSKLDEITTKLHDLVEQKDNLGLRINVNVETQNRSCRLEQTSLLDDKFSIVGREGDKMELLEFLLGDEPRNAGVISIVGLGGVGKTTLAKGLYNDMKVKAKFDLRAWVCISDDFNVFNISMAIYRAVGGDDKSFANLDQLHVALKEKLSKKRFILVLDDVWNEDYKKWEVLRSPLGAGAPGSKIVVTTRSHTVASMMDSYETHNLGVLSYEKSLSLFAQSALDEQNFDNHPKLKLHGEGIVKKCGGLPLALITLGRALRMKKDDGDHDDDEWEKVLNSEIWDLKDAKDILPALRLSYYDLAPHLKHLFAYCSFFPKDFVFDKNELVKLWLAEGFLYQSNGSMSKESLGCQYFEELNSRSLFQPSTIHKSWYVMHDLINDLAKSVAGDFYITLGEMDVRDINQELVKFRHFSFLGEKDGVFRKFMELERAKCLRTFMKIQNLWWPQLSFSSIVLQELLPQLHFVRVLSLENCHIGEVPYSIGCLKHLRYLNLCRNPIKQLPEQVTDLYNLQTLLISGCRKVSILPNSFEKLKHLRHLDISDTPLLTKMPLGLNGLTSLQTLCKVIIEGDNGFKISDLKHLANLQGPLSIKGLDKVINPIQAKNASLNQKKGLYDLEMEWGSVFEYFETQWLRVFDDSYNETTEYEVLQGLKPHYKLRSLKILFYGGNRFPSWVGDPLFDQLRELTLCGCIGCEHLPTLGNLQSLQMLSVESLNEMVNLDSMFLAHTNSVHPVAFPSLTALKFKHMPRWERWSTSVGGDNATSGLFPRLGEIYIGYCPKLTEVSIGFIPSLGDATIEFCDILKSYSCPNSVENLYIGHCGSLTSLTFSTVHEIPSSLKSLHIIGCNNLRTFGEGSFIYLTDLCIRDCDNIETIEEGFGFLPLSCLKSIIIEDCKNLKSFPHEHLQSLDSLETLEICACPSLDFTFPCGSWPPNLSSLTMGCLNKPISDWGLQHLPDSLNHLSLNGQNSGVKSFDFLLPQSLASLEVLSFEDLESLSDVLPHLICLRVLLIEKCSKLKDMPEETSSLTVWVS